MSGPRRAGSAAWDPLSVCPSGRRPLLERYGDMLAEMNRSVNLVSRESVDGRWRRHILHSLVLGHRSFPDGARVVDWGTGGGLPLVPLAVCFPSVEFVGVDAVRKKVMAVRTMLRRLELGNADVVHSRAESWGGTAQYSVSRATAPLEVLWGWHLRVAGPADTAEGCWRPGLVCLKGGDLTEEIGDLRARHPGVEVDTIPLAEIVSIAEFVGKHIVSVTSE